MALYCVYCFRIVFIFHFDMFSSIWKGQHLHKYIKYKHTPCKKMEMVHTEAQKWENNLKCSPVMRYQRHNHKIRPPRFYFDECRAPPSSQRIKRFNEPRETNVTIVFCSLPEWLHSALHGGSGEPHGRGSVLTGQRLQSEHRHRGKWANTTTSAPLSPLLATSGSRKSKMAAAVMSSTRLHNVYTRPSSRPSVSLPVIRRQHHEQPWLI